MSSKLYVDSVEPKTTGGNINITNANLVTPQPISSFLDVGTPIIKLNASGDQGSLTQNNWHNIALQTATIDTHSLKDGDGFTVTADTAGYWVIQAHFRINNYGSWRQILQLTKNGNADMQMEIAAYSDSGSEYKSSILYNMQQLVAGDTMTLKFYHPSGTTLTSYKDNDGVFLMGWRIK